MNKEHLYKIKKYEKDFEISIPKDKHIIIRIDGHKFSKLSKKYFNKPFDNEFSNSMIEAMKAVFNEFNASFGYTQSDEITIIIPENKIKKGYTHPYNGRVQKIASLSASLASIKFCETIRKLKNEKIDAWFDARVFSVPKLKIVDAVAERKRDAIRNSKSMFSRAYASHNELKNKFADEQIKYVKNKYNKDWNDIDDRFKYGVFIKKEKIIKNDVIRTKNIILPLKEYITYNLIVSKYYEKDVKNKLLKKEIK
jgi:tRNA(His) 5'-end guanylyltransferase